MTSDDELEGEPSTPRGFAPEANAKLASALAKLDRVDADFKTRRDNERDQQLLKKWTKLCRTMSQQLERLARVLYESHQISVVAGIEGGGRGARPFLDESMGTLQRLEYRLDQENVVASCGERDFGRIPLARLTPQWVEESVVHWVLKAVENKVNAPPR